MLPLKTHISWPNGCTARRRATRFSSTRSSGPWSKTSCSSRHPGHALAMVSQAAARHCYSDNVADLMVHRLERLTAPQRDLLRVVSAAGSHCDERPLRQVLAQPPGEPLKALIRAKPATGPEWLAPRLGWRLFMHSRPCTSAPRCMHASPWPCARLGQGERTRCCSSCQPAATRQPMRVCSG